MTECSACEKKKKNKLLRIAEGYVNLAKAVFHIDDPELEKLANSRLERCNGCPYRRLSILVNDKPIYGCSKCKCPLEAKVRSKEESCPEGLW